MVCARANIELGLVPVVRVTPKLYVVHCRRATHGIWRNVMKFKEALFGTSAAVAADEGTAAVVAEPYRTLHFSRDLSRAGYRAAPAAGAVRGGELLLYHGGFAPLRNPHI